MIKLRIDRDNPIRQFLEKGKYLLESSVKCYVKLGDENVESDIRSLIIVPSYENKEGYIIPGLIFDITGKNDNYISILGNREGIVKIIEFIE